jgi:hypothetical protein
MPAKFSSLDDQRMIRLDQLGPTTIPWLPDRISRSTAYRAASAPPGAPRLQTYRIGTHRYTTGRDLREWLAAAKIGRSAPTRTPAARQRQLATAQRVLLEAGI